MFENAKTGDKVWSIRWGWGKIVDILKNTDYPLIVNFSVNNSYTFTIDGKYNENDINPILFWGKINFEIPEKPKPKFWEPENGEKAYYINAAGKVVESTFWCGDTEDKNAVKQGIVFKTATEADREIELRKAKYRVKKRIWELNGGEFIEFNTDEYNWTFDLYSNKIVPEFWPKTKSYPNWQYLKNRELVEQLINEIYNDLMLIRSE